MARPCSIAKGSPPTPSTSSPPAALRSTSRRAAASLRVRRIATFTLVGEMGFFRHSVRSATVSSEGPTDLFTLTRANFERMRRERPDLANAFDDFIIRIISDRVDSAHREVAAPEPLIS